LHSTKQPLFTEQNSSISELGLEIPIQNIINDTSLALLITNPI